MTTGLSEKKYPFNNSHTNITRYNLETPSYCEFKFGGIVERVYCHFVKYYPEEIKSLRNSSIFNKS